MIDFEEQPIGRGDHPIVRGHDASLPALTGDHQRISTRAEFQEAIRRLLALSAGQGAREIWLCDADFSQWPLGEIKVLENLTAWAGARRKLVLLALDFTDVPRRHPRFVTWRRQWSHVVESRMLVDIDASQVPMLAWAQDVSAVRMTDPLNYGGLISAWPSELSECRERLDAVVQRSVEAFPVTTLGL